MTDISLPLENPFAPQIIAVEKDFLVVYKPPRMHSAPLAGSAGETLLDWCVREFPETAGPCGRKPGEGGLVHRLDYETQGLLLVARTDAGMEALLLRQREKRIVKEYSALALESGTALPGFPPADFPAGRGVSRIESAFRPYGPGRKAVRPAADNVSGASRKGAGAELYHTEISRERVLSSGIASLRIRIVKGFRHQIRCHLAWLGRPILNDDLYGGAPYGKGFLALRAAALSFADPSSGEERSYSIPHLEPDAI